MSAKRKTLSFAEKNKIIEDFEKSKLSKAAFSKQIGIPRTSLNTILAAQTTVQDSTNLKRKRQRISPFDKIEEALLIWIKLARSQNAPVSCLVLKEKALQIAAELGIGDFTASNGWIQRFQSRHDLTFKKICGEAGDVDDHVIKDWKDSVLGDVCKRYRSCDIFNVDECGLFYRLLPEKTLSFRNERCTGGKKSKERLTVFLAANMDGSEKLTPVVIGKFKKPRCFKNVKSLPVCYEANGKAWMNTDIWEKTIRRFDRHFFMNKRKVVIIADNCTAHCPIPNLKSIELVFLPPNVTSILQPLDQGVIQNLKVKYRKMLLKDMIAAIDNKKEFHVSVLDAVLYIDKSWNEVSTKCISNCFKHAGFQHTPENEEILDDDDDDDEDLPISELARRLRNLGCVIPDEIEYATIDSNICTNSESSISEIVAQVLDENALESDNSENEYESYVETASQKEALSALNVIRRFFVTSDANEEHFKTVNKLEKIVQKMKPKEKQSCITDFFN